MTGAVWQYDAREMATNPDLCPVFEPPPWEWLEDIEKDCE